MIRIHLSKIMGEERINQSELSKKTGIRAATINEIYHELIERINLEHLSKICDVLHCDVKDILEYVPDDQYVKRRKENRREEGDKV